MKTSEFESDRTWNIEASSPAEIMASCELIHTGEPTVKSINKTKLSLLVTPSKEPILQSKDLPSNFNFRHITCVGADTPGKQEVDLEIVKQADLIAFDLFEQGKTSFTTGQISTYSMLRRKIFSVHFDVMNESVAIKVQDEV